MKRLPLTFSILAFSFISYSQQIKTESRIIVKNPLIHQIIPENAVVEILADGFEWTEGPLWLPAENKLIFSDIPSNSIFEWSEKAGKKLYLKPSGFTGKEKREGEPGSNGLLLNASGELILCQHGDRRVAKMDASLSNPKANFISLTDNYNGKKLNSPNDAAYHKNGDLYFTDPPYGLEKNVNDPAKELDFQGVFQLEKTGEVVLLTKELSRPNGIAFSPDYSKLYVANSDPARAIWMVYDLDKSGLLKNGKLFFDATAITKNFKGLPDGLKVHPNGWVFATGPGGVLVFTPGGEHLGTIFTGEATANCAFNTDYSELFLTADDFLLRVRLK
ncbi:SMP-30/gluconolactonase/LRE family protein [Mariniphaga sp.]|uniref:SMP-30/gluconolactonase/LRE family protein n=1 Tax=Mariniphaga sp. TaxID=1954475 RepID=UPI003562595D